MSEGRMRANYALVDFGEHLGEDEEALDVPWAEFVGDRTAEHEFTVPAAPVADAYLTLQAFDVGSYGHEIRVNGDALTGFDIPPAAGWQTWMETVTGTEFREGTNTLQVVRDPDSVDAFVVGTVAVHWREPVDRRDINPGP